MRGCATGDGRLAHDDKAAAVEMLDQALGHDRRHDLSRIMYALAAAVPQRESEGFGDILGLGRS